MEAGDTECIFREPLLKFKTTQNSHGSTATIAILFLTRVTRSQPAKEGLRGEQGHDGPSGGSNTLQSSFTYRDGRYDGRHTAGVRKEPAGAKVVQTIAISKIGNNAS